jgi:hypothetical protein
MIAIFDADRQEILERNHIQLASPKQVQDLFRQQLAKTHQPVADLRELLSLPTQMGA